MEKNKSNRTNNLYRIHHHLTPLPLLFIHHAIMAGITRRSVIKQHKFTTLHQYVVLPGFAVFNRMTVSLASLLISAQELFYAVKVELIDSLLTGPSFSSNTFIKVSMA
jgi:hypothetical protein